MAYSKQTWVDLPDKTTPINAERLNHMEDGIEEAYEHGGGDAIPVGTEVDYNGVTAPEGWEAVTGNSLTEYQLYDNSSGTTGQVDLSETSANFKYLEIYYKTNDADYGSIKVYSPNGKKVAIFVNHPTGTTSNTTNYMKSRVVNISGTTITTSSYSEISINHNASPTISQTNNIYIVRVVGYKEE